MKYKLLKDTPTIKAGTIFEEVTSDFDELKELVRITPIGAKTSPQFTIQDINNFDEWFEEIEEPTDSTHWKPKIAEKYFYINEYGDVEWEIWNDDNVDNRLMAMGLVYPTEEACRKAKERKLAEVRLCKTSDFEPVFESEYGGWIVYFDYENRMLDCAKVFSCDRGELVHYATKEDAKKSIKENERDWKIYFGIKEEE
jgi:hypothetical protein